MLINWVAALEPLTRGGWHWDLDGKFKMAKVSQPHDTPWLHAPYAIPGSIEDGIDCGYLTMFHNYVLKQKGAHSFCMECYKVVVMPETLEQVQKIAEWQHGTGWACKVGAERRNYTQRKWGAYFYCRGVEQGRERYKQVREWVDENLGKHIGVILKRGCTEFEQHMGDSDKWQMLPHQEEIEEEAKKVVHYEPMPPIQAESIQHHVWDIWDDWDKMNRPPVTYHEKESVEE
jgi:hypothetical protein